jgi:hypothetical protein
MNTHQKNHINLGQWMGLGVAIGAGIGAAFGSG